MSNSIGRSLTSNFGAAGLAQECNKKCPPNQKLDMHKVCRPECTKGIKEKCAGRWGDACYNDPHCFETYFNWGCSAGDPNLHLA